MGCSSSTPAGATASKAAPKSPPPKHNPRRRGSISAEADKLADNYQRKVIPKTDEQRDFLKAAVAGIFLFEALPPSLLREVVDAMERREVKPGEVLMRQGAEGDNFYVIEGGDFKVVKNGEQVFTYAGHGFFGELALMYNGRRAATVEASSAGVVWALDRVSFRHILTTAQKKRIHVSEESLGKVPILESLPGTDRAKLADALVTREYAPGEVVIAQGAYGDVLYLVEEGTAVAYRADDKAGPGGRKEVNRHSAGDFFGERALITDEPRAATIVAETPLKVWTVDRPAFERLIGSAADIKERMGKRMQNYEK